MAPDSKATAAKDNISISRSQNALESTDSSSASDDPPAGFNRGIPRRCDTDEGGLYSIQLRNQIATNLQSSFMDTNKLASKFFLVRLMP